MRSRCGFPPACLRICSGGVPIFAAPSARSRRPPRASALPTADLFPKFSITGTAGLESISTSDFFFGTSRMWSVGPSMTWPIFEGGRIRAYIEVRNAQEEQALLIYRKTVLNALAEVEDALVAYAKERTRHQALAASAQDFKRSEITRARTLRGGLCQLSRRP